MIVLKFCLNKSAKNQKNGPSIVDAKINFKHNDIVLYCIDHYQLWCQLRFFLFLFTPFKCLLVVVSLLVPGVDVSVIFSIVYAMAINDFTLLYCNLLIQNTKLHMNENGESVPNIFFIVFLSFCPSQSVKFIRNNGCDVLARIVCFFFLAFFLSFFLCDGVRNHARRIVVVFFQFKWICTTTTSIARRRKKTHDAMRHDMEEIKGKKVQK